MIESTSSAAQARRHAPLMALCAAACLALGACTDPASLTPDTDPNANTRGGAIAGAIVGAGVGLIAGGDQGLKNAAVGAAAGAIVGAGAGSLLDQQAADIRNSLANDGITVVNDGSRLVVTLPQDITFDTGSAEIRPNLQSELNKLAANFVQYKNSNLLVIGHTDNVGDAAFNQTLSEQRAGAVSAALINGGVEPNRISVTGVGENQPIASNLTPEGRAQNRRVEIIVVPKSGL
ncbi:MAG: OmpA family protein [Pseudomonadota bacterium]